MNWTAETRFGAAWVMLAGALAAHVTDEALTGFLSVYNPAVLAIRERIPWSPLPTFTFEVWIVELAALVALLFLLSPFAFRGARWLSLLAIPFSVLMVGNGLGHVGASILWRQWMPGVYSSPVLIVTASFVLIYAVRVRRKKPEGAEPVATDNPVAAR